MKRYNYLFEDETGPFFVYCETGLANAIATAQSLADEYDGGELEYIDNYTDTEAEVLGFDTY